MFSRSVLGLALARRVLAARAPQAQALHASAYLRFQRATLTTTPVSRADNPELEQESLAPNTESKPSKAKPNYMYDDMCSPFEQRIVAKHGQEWRRKASRGDVNKMRRVQKERAQWQKQLSDGLPFSAIKPEKQETQPQQQHVRDGDGKYRHWAMRRKFWLAISLYEHSFEELLEMARQTVAESATNPPRTVAGSRKLTDRKWLLRAYELHRDDWENVLTDNMVVNINPGNPNNDSSSTPTPGQLIRRPRVKCVEAWKAGCSIRALEASKAGSAASVAAGQSSAVESSEAEDIPAEPVLSRETEAPTTESEHGQEPEPSRTEAAHADSPAGTVVEPAQTPEPASVEDAHPAADGNETSKDEQATETTAPAEEGKSQ